MRSEFLFAVVVLLIAVTGVRYLETKAAGHAQDAALAEEATQQQSAKLSAYYASVDREVRIQRGAHDQFFVTAAVNRHPASFLVDTGASYVALRESDAAASGIYTKMTDFVHPVRTANGETKAAMITIKAMEIGELKVDNVKAFILPDDQLGMNLLGMSFLSRLKSVQAANGELILKG